MNINEKNILLFLGIITPAQVENVRELETYLKQKFEIALLTSKTREINQEVAKSVDHLLRTNIKRIDRVEATLAPIHDRIAAILSLYENTMPLYSRLVSLFPYLKTPTPQSIMISNDKSEMRKVLHKYAPKTIPRFMMIKDVKPTTIDEVVKIVKFPCVVKPANLSMSQLIMTCYDENELISSLTDSFKKIRKLYKINNVELEPRILVEQFIEGDLYSVDVYVNSTGKLYYTPFIEIKTGKDIGYDDFFMYTQITKSNLDPKETESAKEVVGQAVHAFGIRSCTAHVEFYKTKKGYYKIVEIGARPGGFRDEILKDAYGLQHNMNDILIRLGKKPDIKLKKKEYSAFMKFWPKKAGRLKSIKGIKKIKEFPFVTKTRQMLNPGDRVGLSKFGYRYICAFNLVAKTRSDLQANMRKIEKALDIQLMQ
ncbi:MAG TPA: ATP-grasp domain-containing protein [Patescibacteria group bacterium]|nr:ATP-grasp domain-containing protein [Patescibacteria group bacterium]